MTMTQYDKILAVVDFGELSDAVIQSAVMQAEYSGAVLAVLHVVDFTRPIDDDYILPPHRRTGTEPAELGQKAPG